jgi:hypothetical protein
MPFQEVKEQVFSTGSYYALGVLWSRVIQLTYSVGRREAQFSEQLQHAVDREEYLRRDREVQHALERMATKDELRDVNDTLRSIQQSIAPLATRSVADRD